MTCPKCKMENAEGSTFCEFCHELFKGRSAADTYLQAMRRVRAQEDGGVPTAEPVEPFVDDVRRDSKPARVHVPLARRIGQVCQRLFTFVIRFWRPLAFLGVGLILLFLVQNSLDPVIRFHYLGARLTYVFPPKVPLSYVVGSTCDVTRWSERSAGQLDTPLGDVKIDEIGTVDVQGAPGHEPKTVAATLTSNNWLLNIHRKKGLESHSLSGQKNLLAPSYFLIDRRGYISRRQRGSSIRIAKGAAFLACTFPPIRLREDSNWTDSTQWTDEMDGWWVRWDVQRQWHVKNAAACGNDLCIELHYDALLSPAVINQPAWMAGAAWTAGTLQGNGDLVFDATTHAVVSHHLDYGGILHASVPDVGRIPKTMRVGRRAFHARGEVIFNLKNSSSLQRN